MNQFAVTLKHENKEKVSGCAHKIHRTLLETYDVLESDIPALLIELLDLPFDVVDGKRVVIEPSMEKLHKNLGAYVQDEKFLLSEFKRQKKAHRLFKTALKYVNSPSVKFIALLVSKNEAMRIEHIH